jgi:SAM-dependent methyltransferase/tetratricopeptide (TPR) repeat protein
MGTTDYRAQYDDYWSRSDRIGETSGELDRVADHVVMCCGLGKILDIGSGEGFLVAALLRRGADAYGVDVSERVIARSNERISDRFTCGSVLALPYADATFDTIVSTDCMEHLAPEDVPKALAEIHRVAVRQVYLRIATTRDRDEHWHLTVEGRAWWEARCFEAGFRKHPSYYRINPYESLNHDGWQIVVPLEKIPADIFARHPLGAVVGERDLHMDMLREVGKRSDAHVVRYQWAASYIKPGDRVLDAAGGLGYGSHVLRSLTRAASVTGIAASQSAIDYARACFPGNGGEYVGSLSDALAEFAEGSFEIVTAFDALERSDDPIKLVSEFHKVLSPGGRLIVSVPNEWSDDTGRDPNSHHLQVYNWQRLKDELARCFILESAFAQTASRCKVAAKGNAWEPRDRLLREVALDGPAPADCEWWLMVGMKTPVGARQTYTERVFQNIASSGHASIRYSVDYANPWLLHSMVNAGFRLRNANALKRLAQQVLDSADLASNDYLAALCVKAYRILEAGPVCSPDAFECLAGIRKVLEGLDDTPVRLRWKVSLLFAMANLQQALGRLIEAKSTYVKCANQDAHHFGIHLATKTTEAWYSAGKIACAMGNREEAKALWTQGIEYGNTLLGTSLDEILINPDFPNRFNFGDGVREYTLAWDNVAKCANGVNLIASGGLIDLVALETSFLTEKQWVNNDLLETRQRLGERLAQLGLSAGVAQGRADELAETRKLLADRTARLERSVRDLLQRTAELVETRQTLAERTAVLNGSLLQLKESEQELAQAREQLAEQGRLLELGGKPVPTS